MIEFFSETDFTLSKQSILLNWIEQVIKNEGFELGDITYVFCDDDYLHKLNLQFLEHDTLTDIISFDYSLGKQIHGEIYISTERVEDNAKEFKVPFEEELHRVMIHGILHYCGYKDKTKDEAAEMRRLENQSLSFLKPLLSD